LPITQVGVASDLLYTWGYGEEVRKGHQRADMRKVFEHIKACLATGISVAAPLPGHSL
jgi:hypothetical protein